MQIFDKKTYEDYDFEETYCKLLELYIKHTGKCTIPEALKLVAIFLEKEKFYPQSEKDLREFFKQNLKEFVNFLYSNEIWDIIEKLRISKNVLRLFRREVYSIASSIPYKSYSYLNLLTLLFGDIKTSDYIYEEPLKKDSEKTNISLENPLIFIFELYYYSGMTYKLKNLKSLLCGYIIYLYYKEKGRDSISIFSILEEFKNRTIKEYESYLEPSLIWLENVFGINLPNYYIHSIKNLCIFSEDKKRHDLSVLCALSYVLYRKVDHYILKSHEFKQKAAHYLCIDVDKYLEKIKSRQLNNYIKESKYQKWIKPIEYLVKYIDNHGKNFTERFVIEFIRLIFS